MKYKGVLFDLDGTILNSEPLHFAAFQSTLDKHGKRLDEKQYKEHFAGRSDEAGLLRYFKFINEDVNVSRIVDEKARKFLELASDQVVPYPGVIPLIRYLYTQVPLALVTGASRIEAEITLKSFTISNCFTVIITSEDVKNSKPSPEGYLKATNILHLNPKDCVVVEDSPSGVLAAKNAGIDCIAVTNTHTSEELSQATKVVDQLDIHLFNS